MTRSVSANARFEIPYRSATSAGAQPPSAGTFVKMTRIATKSRNDPTKWPTAWSANDARYCSCARICAAVSRANSEPSSSASPTLYHQLPHAEREDGVAGGHERGGPRELREERDDDGAARGTA